MHIFFYCRLFVVLFFIIMAETLKTFKNSLNLELLMGLISSRLFYGRENFAMTKKKRMLTISFFGERYRFSTIKRLKLPPLPSSSHCHRETTIENYQFLDRFQMISSSYLLR